MNNEEVEMPKKNFDGEKIIEESKNLVKEDAKTYKRFFKDAKDYLTTRNTKELGELVLRLALIAVVIIILYLPFELVINVGEELFRAIGINYTEESRRAFESSLNIAYNLFGLAVFFMICKDRFYKMVELQDKIKKAKN